MLSRVLCNDSHVLKGQISVGMFLSWRRRCEAVWAVASSIRVLSCRSSANWLTALLLLLLTPLANILRKRGEAWRAYRDGAAQLQCLAHKELGALTHRHPGSLTHHHHGRGAHGQGASSFEHGEGWSGEWRVVVLLDVQSGAVTGASRLELVKSEVACPAIAESLIGCAQSAHRHPHNFT